MASKRRSNRVPVTLFSFQDIITTLSGILILLTLLMAVEVIEKKGNPQQDPVVDDDAEDQVLADLRARLTALRNCAPAPLPPAPERLAGQSAAVVAAKLVEEEAMSKRVASQLDEATRTHAGLEEKRREATAKLEAVRAELVRARDAAAAAGKELDALRKDKRLTLIPEKLTGKKPLLVECSKDSILVSRLGERALAGRFGTDYDARRAFQKFIAESFSPSANYVVFMVKPSGLEVGFPLIDQVRGHGFDVGYDALEEEFTVCAGQEAPL